MYTVELQQLICEKTSDLGKEKDEVWMLLQPDCGAVTKFPFESGKYHSIKPNSTWDLRTPSGGPLRMSFRYDLSVTLYDVTSPDLIFELGGDDCEFLGDCGFVFNSVGDEMKMTNGHNSSYRLKWRWVSQE